MQVFFCMVDKKNPARRGAGKRSAPGLRKQPGARAGAIAGQQVKTAPARAAGENGAGQGSR